LLLLVVAAALVAAALVAAALLAAVLAAAALAAAGPDGPRLRLEDDLRLRLEATVLAPELLLTSPSAALLLLQLGLAMKFLFDDLVLRLESPSAILLVLNAGLLQGLLLLLPPPPLRCTPRTALFLSFMM
jgi:hypothetical protein